MVCVKKHIDTLLEKYHPCNLIVCPGGSCASEPNWIFIGVNTITPMKIQTCNTKSIEGLTGKGPETYRPPEKKPKIPLPI